MSQIYAWDDQGLLWRSMRHCPGEPPPESWVGRELGGRITIEASGQNVSIVEENYAWAPHADSPPGACPVFYKTVTRKTHVAKDGIVYESRQTDDQPPVTSQRVLHGTQIMYFGSLSSVPRSGAAGIQLAGTDTIAGHPCQRMVLGGGVQGAATISLCVFAIPRSCFLSHYVQVLEQKNVGPDGTISILGRTLELRLGHIGEVLPKNAITAP